MAFDTLLVLGNGFILTALVWGSALCAIVDGRLRAAAAIFAATGIAVLFGVVHSPLRERRRSSGPGRWPARRRSRLAGGYGVAAALLLLFDARQTARCARSSRLTRAESGC